MTNGKRQLGVQVGDDLYRRLRERAAEEQRSLGQVIRMALDSYLRKGEAK